MNMHEARKPKPVLTDAQAAARNALLGKGPRFHDVDSYVKGYEDALSEVQQLLVRHVNEARQQLGLEMPVKLLEHMAKLVAEFAQHKRDEWG